MDTAPSNLPNANKIGSTGKSQKRPMKFMFIDSTDHGTNAKPNKAVRSFVMHQARRQKPWSTRKSPQSPNAGTGPALSGSKRSPSDLYPANGEIVPDAPWLEYDPSPNAWISQNDGSPVSRGSSISGRSSQPYLTPPPSCNSSTCCFPRCDGESCGQLHTALARRDDLALGLLDPFDCLPIKTDEKMGALINHWVKVISPNLLPMDLHQSSTSTITQWVNHSLRNETSAPFTYAMVTSSAMHLQAMGAKQAENSLYYKGQAISEINNSLSNPKASIDDNNITAVFMLLCLEESSLAPVEGMPAEDAEWNERQRQIHLNGLKAMIQQRGGLAALSRNKCLQVFILMHAIAHSIASFQRPYTTLLDPTGAPQKYDLPSFRSRPSSARTLRLFRELKLDSELLDIVSNIVVFNGDISSWFEDRRCPVDPLDLQKHVCLLMYRLFDWYTKPIEVEEAKPGAASASASTPPSGEEKDRVMERDPLDQSICLGLLIFLVRSSQPLEQNYRAMIQITVRKLRTALSACPMSRWVKATDLLLWTLTIGALASQGSTESEFFSRQCAAVFKDAGYDPTTTTTEDLLKRMRRGVWNPVLLDEEVGKLWISIGVVRREEDFVVGRDAGMRSPEIKEDDAVGLLTSTRFFSNKKS
ncbi:hypothetical protein BCR34DRAFT_596656 [Clohesyomyces aquaticus]|uniref:Uncharacterized protein n=1 Tax=Clohesyomyces aquaticus TaxID=1231657 RepID=A0A1Y2A5J7_9PLEO|nr:hypothetical protein BCR34DRAFT_596656 [Clohesyomyces aquaticus]